MVSKKCIYLHCFFVVTCNGGKKLEKEIRLIYRLTAQIVNQGNTDESFEINEFIVGYFEGNEEDAEKLCSKLEQQSTEKYTIPEDNEHIVYPIYRQCPLAKISI